MEHSRHTTTPFRSPFDGALFAAQARLKEQQKAEQGNNERGSFDKWQLLRALTQARIAFALSDRTITVLEALLSFHPSKQLDGSQPIIVFPSNAELGLRTRGMAPATLRRHIATLVHTGLVTRRDSPNGKRYAARDTDGQIAEAYGFDLAPLALAATDIHEAAEQAERAARALRRMRATITCHLRDIRNIVDAGLSEREDQTDTWSALADDLGGLSGRLPRNATLEELEPRREGLARLHVFVERAWLDGCNSADLDAHAEKQNKEVSANDVIIERHIQNSKAEPNLIKSQEKAQKRETEQHSENSSGRSTAIDEMACKDWKPEASYAPEVKSLNADPRRNETGGDGEGGRRDSGPAQSTERADGSVDVGPERLTRLATPGLASVLSTCPQIIAYGGGNIRNWQDMMAAADLVRTMLGVSPSAWKRAVSIMGQMAAATVIAAMLERAEEIKSPGGYLRALTGRAEAGQFTLAPMLKALGA
ncbi:plasmid replication protein RepC [Ahrensia sp. R2A130]|uniref:plasmid replication protein RepC n=1 Tax=Ahrensia sp. R2A130 TaxID=744979 RepID=UPI0001E0F137|nr:plasmid replication protein RepC [Ahrensia sp. R2A130]EFL87441.1 replication protein C [Ahrensia sp. R2A130]